jgi:hypothetical protein
MEANEFSTESLLKAGRGIESSGVSLRQRYRTDNVSTKYDHPKGTLGRTTTQYRDGSTTVGTTDRSGKYSMTLKKPDGSSTTIHTRDNTVGVDERGHGNFTADIKNPNGSSEHVRQWVSGLSASDHGVHTRRDAKGNLTSRFQVDNIKSPMEGNTPMGFYTENRVHGYHAPTPASSDLVGGSPAASGRWSVSPARQAQVAAAQPQSAPAAGGTVGGAKGHAFHGNQFTPHGTDVPVQSPQVPAKKSLTGTDFSTESLTRGQGIFVRGL